MFSADNTGLILVWRTTISDSKRHQPCHPWCVEKVQETILFVMFDPNLHITPCTYNVSDGGFLATNEIEKNCETLHVLSWQRIDERELVGVAINMLQLHPNGRCLLIHAKDSVLRVMDLRM